MYIGMFFTDITLFYVIPLVVSMVLYTLIATMLLYTAPRTFQERMNRNKARLQVTIQLGIIQVMTYFRQFFTFPLSANGRFG